MSRTTSSQSKNFQRKSRAAERKLALFERRFGSSHIYLLCHAAFPIALTPNLLYHLWANFQRDIHGNLINVPWVAVSDVLLSGLCQEVGLEVYEMDADVRSNLLQRLQDDENLGQQRIQELSEFLLDHVQHQLQSNDIDIRDFAEAQKLTVLIHTSPVKAAHELALAFQQLNLDAKILGQLDKAELSRLASLIDNFSKPLEEAGLESLSLYACGMEDWVRGNFQEAAEKLDQALQDGKLTIVGVDLSVPEEMQPFSQFSTSLPSPDYTGQNLRGQSFRGQNLTGANFSNADIRGADFTSAILTGANFNKAQLGLQRRWLTILVLLISLVVALSGLTATYIGWLGYSSLINFFKFFPSNPNWEDISLSAMGFLCIPWFIFLSISGLKYKTSSLVISASLALFCTSFLSAIALFLHEVLQINWLISRSPNTTSIAMILLVVPIAIAFSIFAIKSKSNRIRAAMIILFFQWGY